MRTPIRVTKKFLSRLPTVRLYYSRGASARTKFDNEQFAALFNELQAGGNK